MKQALIWDLDGTLFDSYPIYVRALQETMAELGHEIPSELIYQDVITYTIGHFIERMAEEKQIPQEQIKESYMQRGMAGNDLIQPMKHAKELLQRLSEMGVLNFVYTHKDITAVHVLENIGLLSYFDEVLTADSGFRRKPDPEAVLYLMDKYQLPAENTYYVGDRCLDIDCGWNAGIKSILFLPPDSPCVPNGRETHIVSDLLEIADIVKNEKE